MAGARKEMMMMNMSRRVEEYGRPIPKRGQVKVTIVLGLAHSLSSIFSTGGRSQSSRSSSTEME
ncbi:hypothetical protein RND71_033443 [Anisodus tanguticus]|uniref:Uncharacterized protein n=1 Tax=Anisodus tanguticus TaxID=243964 RepID=A0AAE1R9C4_9SOLA|nr:hypothetical protein RND71_033443 [Anisodus tanguticus]